MAIDTPARLAILGAGPIGLEAALYARFLGYDVDIYERGDVGANVRRWGHVRMFTPFGRNRSPLGLAALLAQDPNYQPPADGERLTGAEWLERYLLPLAHSDLLEDHLRLGVEVTAIGRPRRLKGDDAGTEDRRDDQLRLIVRDAAGVETASFAHAVLDATGTYGQPNWLGAGGLPALGETACRDRITYWLPDLAGRDRDAFAGRRVLLIGDGDSAASAAVELARLAETAPGTSVVWSVRGAAADAADPMASPNGESPSDRDARYGEARAALHAAARQVIDDPSGPVELRPESAIEAVRWDAADGAFRVRFVEPLEGGDEESFDCVLALVGYRPDERLTAELQVSRCPVTGALLDPRQSPAVASERRSTEEFARASLEPDYYVLGAKSRGRDGDFLFEDGLRQIRQLFAILGDRPNLDLYAGVPRL